jgi:uncharacterized protein YoxC
MMVDIAAIIVAVAFAVLVGYLVPTILQLKRTVGESERLLIRLNHELPALMKEVKGTHENIRTITDQARMGVDRATIFLNAVGDVGQTVHQMHHAVKGKGGTLVVGLSSLVAGLRAASSTIKHRMQKDEHVHQEKPEHQEGGTSHGN